ncbi:hypothetical protein, partial [Bradyrhizobium sp. NBAIM08]|uniref:hypothetical protein n=1 Tax=Bradyrhizobium sp. NBAIM08 TaxID=2793815 RepID=UPI001CD50A64
PQASTGLLARILGDHAQKTIKLQTAVNDARKAGVGVSRDYGHQLLPVVSSLGEHETLGGKPEWKTSVEARWKIKPGRNWKALDLANECLRELILLDSLS